MNPKVHVIFHDDHTFSPKEHYSVIALSQTLLFIIGIDMFPFEKCNVVPV